MQDVITFIKSGLPVHNAGSVTLYGNTGYAQVYETQTQNGFSGLYENLDNRLDEYIYYITKSSGIYYVDGNVLNLSGSSNADTLDNQHGYYYLDRANSSGIFQTSVSGNIAFVAPSGKFTRADVTNLYASQVITSTAFVTTSSTITDLTYSRATPNMTNWTTQGNNVTINWSSTHVQNLPMSGNCILSFTAPGSPCRLQLVLTQDAVGNRVPTWPATVKWPGGVAPTLTTTASGIDIIAFWYNGSNYLGTSALDFR